MLVETRALTGLDEEMLKSNCPVHFAGYVTLTTQMSISLLGLVDVDAVRENVPTQSHQDISRLLG